MKRISTLTLIATAIIAFSRCNSKQAEKKEQAAPTLIEETTKNYCAKNVGSRLKIINEGEIPVFREHILSEEDLIIRKHILNIMCHFFTSWDEAYLQVENIEIHLEKLGEMIEDGLVTIKGNNLSVPEKARPYVRNICMAFDKRLHRNKPETKLFSMTI